MENCKETEKHPAEQCSSVNSQDTEDNRHASWNINSASWLAPLPLRKAFLCWLLGRHSLLVSPLPPVTPAQSLLLAPSLTIQSLDVGVGRASSLLCYSLSVAKSGPVVLNAIDTVMTPTFLSPCRFYNPLLVTQGSPTPCGKGPLRNLMPRDRHHREPPRWLAVTGCLQDPT